MVNDTIAFSKFTILNLIFFLSVWSLGQRYVGGSSSAEKRYLPERISESSSGTRICQVIAAGKSESLDLKKQKAHDSDVSAFVFFVEAQLALQF